MLTYAILLASTMLGGHSSQRGRPGNVFAYSPALESVGESYSQVKRTPPGSTIVGDAGASKTAVKPDLSPSYVNISGNFGGVFYVSGVGGGTSQTQTNLVNITTNRSLTFSANAFKPLTVSQTSDASVGTITYSMAIYQGTSSQIGALVAGPVSGTDAGFNGQSVGVIGNHGPVSENFVLVITRTLTITSEATGACTLLGTGNIGVTIN